MALVTLFANNPSTTAAGSSGTTSPAALTTETWTVASSAAFPAAATGVSQFHIADPALAAEIIAVTNVSGTTWSVTRGVESTTPVAHATGATFYQVVSAGDLTGLAPKDTPALTGTPTAPTATALTSSTQLATTAYTDSAVGAETSRATTAEALKAALASPALTGNPTAPTQAASNNSTRIASTAYADAAVGVETTRATAAEAKINGVAITGTPSAGQVPTATSSSAATWQTPELPVVTFTYGSTGAVPASGTWTAGAAAVDQNSIVRVCTVSGSPGTWARDGALPWQFWVADYGAKGDGRIVGDGAMTASAATLTSTSANFTSGDVGKNIVVNGALGSSTGPLYTTILSVTNSTTAVLNANATNTIASAAAFYASDDSAAIVSAVTASSTYAQANNFKAQVLFQARSYGLATLTITAASGALAQQNALVPIPYPNVNGTTQKLSFELVGAGESADEQYFGSTIPSMTGTCLVATVAASGTAPSIVGGPNASTNLTGTWANTKVIIKGINVWCGFNPGWVGFDLHQCSAVWVDSAAAQVLAPAGGGQNPGLGSLPVNTSGIGLYLPANNDNGAGRIMIEGYYQGVSLSPRSTIEKLFTNTNVIAVLCRTVNSTVTHGARIGYWSCNIATTAISSTGTSGTMPLIIDMFDSAGTITTDLSDAHGTLVGSMNWWHTVSTAPTVAAGFALRITNLRQAPGAVSSPTSPPSTGVAWQNLYWRDAEVTVSVTGGAITALTVDGVDQHIPASCVLWKFTVPSGHSYTPTYTGTLAHDVTLE